MAKNILLVAEGETDVIVFNAIAKHLNDEISFLPVAPQKDATSGTYEQHGFGQVMNWCLANKDKIQMLIDFKGASALFIQMDTDIAGQLNSDLHEQKPRKSCEKALNKSFSTDSEPERCYYILATENTETWLLASHNNYTVLDQNCRELNNYELINNTEQHLISIGYPSRKGIGNKRKLNKKPAKKYNKYAKQLTGNLTLARKRCSELDRLCNLIFHV